MADTLESLEIKVQHNASGADAEISGVATAIGRLKTALTGVPAALKELASAVKTVNDAFKGGTAKYDKFAESMLNVATSAELLGENSSHVMTLANAMNTLTSVKVTAGSFNALAKGVEGVGTAAQTITPEAISNLDKMVTSLAKLQGVDLSGLGSALNSVRRVGNIKPTEAPIPVPVNIQEMIMAANQIDILEAKLESLRVALQEAFAAGDMDKAYSLRGQILQTEAALKKARASANGAAEGVKKLSKEASKSKGPLENFVDSLKRIAFYRIIRSIIKSITQAFSEGLEKAYLFSSGIVGEGNRFAQAMDSIKSKGNEMKGQLGSAFIGLLSAIEPVLIAIINLVTKAADAISQFFAAFTGTTYLKAAEVPQKWADAAKKAGGAAKEWKNQLLGFDEINRLNEPSNGGGGSGTNPLEGFDMRDAPLDDWAKKIHDNLALVETAASGFALGLGLILLFSGGSIPLGLGLIALGVTGMVHALKEDWGSVSAKVAKAVADVAAVVGGALLAVGALLAFTGANIPLGIGLMLGGAASLATSVAINWKAIPNTVGSVVSEILMVLGGALLALGAVIMFATPAFSPLGLGLIVAGAAGLAGGVAINWNNMPQRIRDVVSRILVILGGALVVLGAILCLTGAGIPLGIGLIMAGAASLAGAYAINSGAIIGAVQDACNHIWGIVNGLFQGIHDWIQNVLDGISQFLSLFAIGARADAMAADGSIYLQGFASGGHPDDGQLFIAREGGAEMVGSMGGRTTVATNDDIVEGIRQGVYDAVVAANANGNSDVSVRVYLDSREIRAGQERLARAWG